MVEYICMIVVCYVIGALPMGYIIARMAGTADITQHGSGNIGATNVARNLGIPFFFLIFALDAGKAYAALKVLSFMSESSLIITILPLVLLFGNFFSLFLKGKGGKGISTLCGILLFLDPKLFVLFFGTWFIIVLLTKTVGKGSLGALISLASCAWVLYGGDQAIMLTIASLACLYRHKDNIMHYYFNANNLAKKAQA